MHGLVRCKHERRCSRACAERTYHSDVTIKIPDRGCDQGCEWRHAPEAWAEIWEKSVSWDWDLGEARRICALRAPLVIGVGADGKVSIERLHLSPYVEKPFNSKVIKIFVPELRSRKCFRVSEFLCYIWTLYVRFVYGYVTDLPIFLACRYVIFLLYFTSISFSLLYILHFFFKMQDDSLGSLSISFHWYDFDHVDWVFFYHTFHMLDIPCNFFLVSIFLKLITL